MNSTYEEQLEKYGELIYTNVGTSMMPLIRNHKDLLVIEKKECIKKFDVVLYKRTNGSYVLHRIIKVRKEDYVLCGDNCTYKEYGIKEEQILGVLKRVIRDGKELSLSGCGYQIYTHIWCDFLSLRIVLLKLRNLLCTMRKNM